MAQRLRIPCCHSIKLGKEVIQKPWCLYASSDYLNGRRAEIDFNQSAWYQPFRFLHYPNQQQLCAYQWLYREIPNQCIRPGANSLESVAAMCAAGLGVALLCEGIRTQGLIKLAQLPESTDSHFWLLYHSEQRQRSDIVNVVAQLKELILLAF